MAEGVSNLKLFAAVRRFPLVPLQPFIYIGFTVRTCLYLAVATRTRPE